ncbi:hypothetical protein MKX03_030848 [Papaver bracteatum]|nr:hypothetical protein MKX03_030848 [Papaver bracteatum]
MNPSSEIDADLERFRRFLPGSTLPCVPNAKNLYDEEVRGTCNIPKSVKFTKMETRLTRFVTLRWWLIFDAWLTFV